MVAALAGTGLAQAAGSNTITRYAPNRAGDGLGGGAVPNPRRRLA